MQIKPLTLFNKEGLEEPKAITPIAIQEWLIANGADPREFEIEMFEFDDEEE